MRYTQAGTRARLVTYGMGWESQLTMGFAAVCSPTEMSRATCRGRVCVRTCARAGAHKRVHVRVGPTAGVYMCANQPGQAAIRNSPF